MRSILVSLVLVAACTADVAKAKDEAQSFMQHIPGATSVMCNESDSDHDGYVSCTVFRGDKDPIAISCGAEIMCSCNCASGCKLMPYVGKAR